MKRQLVIYSIVLLIVVTMVGASELLHQHEIIFLEITAIAVGAFMAPKMSWKVSRIRILIFIMICALAGVGIVLFIPGPVWFRVTLTYGITEVIYLLSGTSFAPMISAIAFPVLLGIESPVYFVAAIALCALIGAGCRYLIVMEWNLPLTLASLVAAVGMILILTGLKAFIPPAGALCILPMLIPEEAVMGYPVQIFAGAALFMVFSLTIFRNREVIQ